MDLFVEKTGYSIGSSFLRPDRIVKIVKLVTCSVTWPSACVAMTTVAREQQLLGSNPVESFRAFFAELSDTKGFFAIV